MIVVKVTVSGMELLIFDSMCVRLLCAAQNVSVGESDSRNLFTLVQSWHEQASLLITASGRPEGLPRRSWSHLSTNVRRNASNIGKSELLYC